MFEYRRRIEPRRYNWQCSALISQKAKLRTGDGKKKQKWRSFSLLALWSVQKNCLSIIDVVSVSFVSLSFCHQLCCVFKQSRMCTECLILLRQMITYWPSSPDNQRSVVKFPQCLIILRLYRRSTYVTALGGCYIWRLYSSLCIIWIKGRLSTWYCPWRGSDMSEQTSVKQVLVHVKH